MTGGGCVVLACRHVGRGLMPAPLMKSHFQGPSMCGRSNSGGPTTGGAWSESNRARGTFAQRSPATEKFALACRPSASLARFWLIIAKAALGSSMAHALRALRDGPMLPSRSSSALRRRLVSSCPSRLRISFRRSSMVTSAFRMAV